jgi:DNA polymerase III epsilon subunit-like protein
MTKGATIVGAVPNFDVERLDNLCKRYGYRMFNHYHLVDVENLVAGKSGLQPPWRSDDLFATVGIDSFADEYQKGKHTALGDARVVRDVYDKVMAKSDSRSNSSLQGEKNLSMGPMD